MDGDGFDFGRGLNVMLEREGVTRKFLADTIAVDRNTVSSWTRCERRPSVDYALAAAEVLGTTVERIAELGRESRK